MNWIISTIKDLAPVIIACFALYFSNKNVSRQIRMNSKVQWIDTFRISIVKLMTRYLKFKNEVKKNEPNHDVLNEFAEQIIFTNLLLNDNDKLQGQLGLIINEITNYCQKDNFNPKIIEDKMQIVANLTEKIIQQEQSKI